MVAVAQPAQPEPPRDRLTTPGVSFAAGCFQVDPDSTLFGRQWIETAHEMAIDPKVRAVSRAVRETLLSARWRWTQGRRTEIAARNASYANRAFGTGGETRRGQRSWEEILSQAINFVDLGYGYMEATYELVRDGDELLWWPTLWDCDPIAHGTWESADGATLDGITQIPWLWSGSGGGLVPADRLVLLTYGGRGNNWEGMGLLRSARYWWRLKNHAAKSLGVALERFAIPTPKVRKFPRREVRELTGWTEAEIDAAYTSADEQAAALVAHRTAALSEIVGVVEYGLYADGALDPSIVDSVIALCDHQIASAYLVSFITEGTKDSTSYGSSRVAESFFRRSAINMLDIIAGVMNGPPGPARGLMARALEYNYGPQEPADLPILVHTGLDVDPLLEVVGKLGLLRDGGFLTPDDAGERHLRSRIGWPVMDEGFSRSAEDRLQSSAGRDPSPGRPERPAVGSPGAER